MGASSFKRLSYAIWFILARGFTACVSSSEAYIFYAGGRDGWVIDPTESYNHWAEHNRFQVNDTIVFPNNEDAGSVLLVTEPDYDACSTLSPVRQLAGVGGVSTFRFDRSGSFFFISGDEDRCQKGQKLYIIVMAVRPTRPAVAIEAPSPGPSSQFLLPPRWASAPDYAHAPGDEGMSRSSSLGAPPPTSGASRLGGVIRVVVVGVLGSLILRI